MELPVGIAVFFPVTVSTGADSYHIAKMPPPVRRTIRGRKKCNGELRSDHPGYPVSGAIKGGYHVDERLHRISYASPVISDMDGCHMADEPGNNTALSRPGRSAARFQGYKNQGVTASQNSIAGQTPSRFSANSRPALKRLERDTKIPGSGDILIPT